MNKSVKILFIILIMSAILFFVTGCGGCDGCSSCGGCCGSQDDESTDKNNDGSSQQEQIPTNLGYTEQQTVETRRTPGICDGISTNTVSATASRLPNQAGGYVYSYSYIIRACRNTLGYSVVLNGQIPKTVKSDTASIGKETAYSSTYESIESYTQLCIRTSDSAYSNYCVPFSTSQS